MNRSRPPFHQPRFRRLAGLGLLFLAAAPAPAQVVHEIGSLLEFVAGHEPGCAYDNWISHVVEHAETGNVYAPDWLDRQCTGFGSFEPADAGGDDRAAATLALLLLMDGAPGTAARLMNGGADGPYEGVRLHDPGLGRDFLLLRERLDSTFVDVNGPGDEDDVTGSFRRGWGLAVLSPGAARPDLCVQVVHPCDDFPAPYLAARLFVDGDAGLLLLNGAGRAAGGSGWNWAPSDPSRTAEHPFNGWFEAWLMARRAGGGDPLTVQIHTYDSVPRPTDEGLVISAGRWRFWPEPPLIHGCGGGLGALSRLRQPVFAAWDLGFEHPPLRLDDYLLLHSDPWAQVQGGWPDSLFSLRRPSELWGYSNSVQEALVYADGVQGSRFVHVEVDELPALAEGLGLEFWYERELGGVADWRHFEKSRLFARPFFDALLAAEDSLVGLRPLDGPAPPGRPRWADRWDRGGLLVWDPGPDPRLDRWQVAVDTTGDVDHPAWFFDNDSGYGLGWIGRSLQGFTDPVTGRRYSASVRRVLDDGRVSAWSPPFAFMLDETEPPLVDLLGPRLVRAGEASTVVVHAADASGIAGALLEISGEDGVWSERPLLPAGDGLWTAALEGLDGDRRLWLRACVTDGSASGPTVRTAGAPLVAAQDWVAASMEDEAGWTHASIGGADEWRPCADSPFDGLRCWRFGAGDGGPCAPGAGGRLRSPVWTLPPGLLDPAFSFWSRLEGDGGDADGDSCRWGGRLLLALDGGPWQVAEPGPGPLLGLRADAGTALHWPQRLLAAPSPWRQQVVPLPDGTRLVQAAFECVSDRGAPGGSWSLDALLLGGRRPAVPPPPRLELRAVEGGLLLSWPPTTGARGYRLEGAAEPGQRAVWRTLAIFGEDGRDLRLEPNGTAAFFRLTALAGSPLPEAAGAARTTPPIARKDAP